MYRREYFIVLLDSGFIKHQQMPEEEILDQNKIVDQATNMIQLLLFDKIRNQQENMFQIQLFKQQNNDEGEIFSFLESKQPIIQDIKNINNLKKSLQQDEQSIQKTIFVPLIKLIEQKKQNTQFMLRQKKIYYLTTGQSQYKPEQRQINQLKDFIKQFNIKINIILFDYLNDLNDRNNSNNYENNKHAFLDLQSQLKEHVRIFTYDQAIQILKSFNPKPIQNRIKFKGTLQIANLNINVLIYTKTLERKFPFQLKEYFIKLDNNNKSVYKECKMIYDYIYEEQNNQLVDQNNEMDNNNINDENNIIPQQKVRIYQYGNQLVQISDLMYEQTNLETYSCLVLLGTVKAYSIPRSSFMRGTDVVFAQKDVLSKKQFSAFVQALKDQNRYFVCRYVPRKNSVPRLVALIPYFASKYECFYLNELPTSESVRQYPFNSLKQSTEIQQQVISKLIDNMDLEKENIQFDLKQIKNPFFQSINYFIFQKLIKNKFENKEEQDESETLEQIKAETINYMKQKLIIEKQFLDCQNETKQILSQIKNIFNLEFDNKYKENQNKVFWQSLYNKNSSSQLEKKNNLISNKQIDKQSQQNDEILIYQNIIISQNQQLFPIEIMNVIQEFNLIKQQEDIENQDYDSFVINLVQLKTENDFKYRQLLQYAQNIQQTKEENINLDLSVKNLFTENCNDIQIKKISMSQPIRDFKYLTQNVTIQKLQSLTEQFSQIIFEIIDTSYRGSNHYILAKECVQELKKACDQFNIRDVFISFIQEIFERYNFKGSKGFFSYIKEYLQNIVSNEIDYKDLEEYLVNQDNYLPSESSDEQSENKQNGRKFEIDIDEILNQSEHSANVSSCESYIEEILHPQNEYDEIKRIMEFNQEFIKCNDPILMNSNLLNIPLEYKPPQLIGLDECKTPKNFFDKIWDDRIWEMLTVYSNIYAEQYFQKKGIRMDQTFKDQIKQDKILYQLLKHFAPFTKNDIKRFIICEILQGIKRLPCFLDYWSTNPLISGGLNRFISKMKYNICVMFFHASDSSDISLKKDEIGKIKELQNLLNQNFSKYYKHSNFLAIDEGVIPFKGKSHLKVYCPGKPYKYGIKEFLLCDFTGYTILQEIATKKDKQNVYTKNSKDIKNYTHLLVKQLIHGQNNLQNCIIFMDNFYTSISLFEELSQNKIGAVGTVRLDRLKLNKEQKNEIKKDSLKQTGSISFMQKNMHLLFWYDNNRAVKILSNCIGMEQVKSQNIKNPIKDIPLMVKLYNKYSHSVDKRNQLLQYYRTIRRTRKWWKTIFYRLLETSITNSYILYKLKFENTQNMQFSILTHKEFRLRLIQEISQEINSNLLQEIQTQNRQQFDNIENNDQINKSTTIQDEQINNSGMRNLFSSLSTQPTQELCEDQNEDSNLQQKQSNQTSEINIIQNNNQKNIYLLSYQEIKMDYLYNWNEQQRQQFNIQKINQLGINPMKNQKLISLERQIESKKQELFNQSTKFQLNHFVIFSKYKQKCCICKKITKFACDTCIDPLLNQKLNLCPGFCQKTHMLSFFKNQKDLISEKINKKFQENNPTQAITQQVSIQKSQNYQQEQVTNLFNYKVQPLIANDSFDDVELFELPNQPANKQNLLKNNFSNNYELKNEDINFLQSKIQKKINYQNKIKKIEIKNQIQQNLSNAQFKKYKKNNIFYTNIHKNYDLNTQQLNKTIQIQNSQNQNLEKCFQESNLIEDESLFEDKIDFLINNQNHEQDFETYSTNIKIKTKLLDEKNSQFDEDLFEI
uniref:Tpb6p n=1 Tax=Tetrahymena thermophila TaxID=5911 RepID=A0A1S7UEL5_TETTH|nr:TPA_inf: Tpb6p [Tetrahymena thermophila]